MPGRPAVFLDRDGVINRAIIRDGVVASPMTADEFELLPGVVDACEQLAESGVLLIVVTNQPEISRGRLAAAEVEIMNDRLRLALPVDDVVVCPHDNADGCSCRKPLPGMLVDAADRFDIDLVRSVMVGDRWKDIAAGAAAGCFTVHIDGGYADPSAGLPDGCTPDATAASLVEGVPAICRLLRGAP